MKRLLLALVMGLGVVAGAEDAPPLAIKAWSEPDTVTIGQRFRYVVEVATAPDVEVVLAQPTERIGDFEIVDFGTEPTVQRDGRAIVTRWYRLVGYQTGYQLVKSPPVLYRVPGQEMQEAHGDDVGVKVESVLGDAGDDADIRDVKGPEPFPFDWRPWWVAGGVLVAVIALAFLVRTLLARRRTPASAPPPRPAHEIAVEALAALRARALPQAGAWKEYYSGLSTIVRAYLEQRFDVRAPEMTTEEFLLTTSRGGRLDRQHRALLGDFLAESDLVKFARHVPTLGDSDRAWASAERFVTETAEVTRLTPERTRAAG